MTDPENAGEDLFMPFFMDYGTCPPIIFVTDTKANERPMGMNLTPTMFAGIYTDAEGRYVYEDGSPIKLNPMTEKHEPLLSDALMNKAEYSEPYRPEGGGIAYSILVDGMTREQVRDFYEDKIASGELRVVRSVTDAGGPQDEWHQFVSQCTGCGRKWMDENGKSEFCPGCGNPIAWR